LKPLSKGLKQPSIVQSTEGCPEITWTRYRPYPYKVLSFMIFKDDGVDWLSACLFEEGEFYSYEDPTDHE
ncbi:MAG: hypothetical protein ACOC3C_04750, partial [Candidatus Thorarchaeota archaeon]